MSDTKAAKRHRTRPASFACDTVVLRADKDTDDLAAPPQGRSRPLFHHQNSTRTEVGRLFATHSPTSPPSPRPTPDKRDSYAMSYTRNILTSERNDISGHLYHRGLLEGRHSDITITAFGVRYALHRIVLDRAPFFASALSPPWLESSSKEVTLHPEETDSNITRKAFEFALARIYGSHDTIEASEDPFALLATASWLEMQELIDDSVGTILASLDTTNLARALEILNESFYGEAGNKILAAAKFMLNREGHDLPADYWDDLPADTIREVIGNDGFFAYSEWNRWLLAKDVLNRRLRSVAAELNFPTKDGRLCKAPRNIRSLVGRLGVPSTQHSESDTEDIGTEGQTWAGLYSHPEVKPLFALLDNDIHYVHLDFEQLQVIRGARDCFGFLVVPEKLINDALWCSMEMRQKIVSSRSTDVALGFTMTCQPEHPSTFLSMQTSPKIAAQDSQSPASSPQHSRRSSQDVKRASLKYRIPSSDCNIASGTAKLSTRLSKSLLADERALRHSPRPNDGQARPLYYAAAQTGDSAHTQQYSTLPPFRFAVEFDRPHGLKDRRRESSRTVFYAGSFWNIYIQRLPASSRNKPPRLGFYLHRVKDPAELERLNSVDERITALERGLRHPRDQPVPWPDYPSRVHGDSDLEDSTSHVRAAMQTLMARPGSSRRSDLPQITSLPFEDADDIFTSPQQTQFQHQHQHTLSESPSSPSSNSKPALNSRNPTLPLYTDTRPEIHAYFKIFVFSPDGRCNNCYQSAIAPFKRSQSWGWKSSTLLAEEDWEDRDEEETIGIGTGMSMGLGRGPLAGVDIDLEGGETDREAGSGTGIGEPVVGRGSPGSGGMLRFMVVLGVV